MKKSLSILIGLGIVALGVWVYKTRTPVALSSGEVPGSTRPVGMETPSATPSTGAASASPATGQAETAAPATELDRILSTLKGPDQRKLLVLDEILKSKNDNDPRLDTEFKQLSPELKRAMTRYYQVIPDEQRNERGTIAFLYARAMTGPQDTEFLTTVLMEKPCLSLADCSKPASGGDREHAHLEGLEETTSNYPQLTAIRQAVQRYNAARGETPPNEALANAIIEMCRKAENSPNPRIAEEARLVLKYLHKQ
jgi:hypothetical protein